MPVKPAPPQHGTHLLSSSTSASFAEPDVLAASADLELPHPKDSLTGLSLMSHTVARANG
jgi:hypothetical protein